MAGNPISYISNTFNSILNDINDDATLKDKPEWFKRLIAGAGDVQSLQRDAAYNNLFLRTAFTRRAVSDLVALIDYELSPQSTSTGNILFYANSAASFPFTVTQANLAALTQGTLTVSSQRFEARSGSTFTAITDTFTTNFAVNNDLTMASLDLQYTGHKVRLTTTGTLPSPLAISTDYYVIYKTTTTIALATSLSDAIAGTEITLTSNGAGTHTLNLYSKAITVYQQDSLSSAVTVGTSDASEWQEYDLPDANVLTDTLVVTVGVDTYTQVNTFVNSISTDKHYKVYQKSDNTFAIQFGNGTYGLIPPISSTISADYSYGGGTTSNITSSNTINIYAGSDTNISAVSNASNSITGGADQEGISSAKRIAPLLLKARDRFITTEDGEALMLAYSDVTQAKVNRNVYGVLSAQVLGIAAGGGNLSASRRSAIQTELINKTILESIDVRVEAATITSTNVTSAAKVLTGFTWTGQVEDLFRLAWRLFLSEAGQEIQDKYLDSGISDAVTLINTIFSTSFNSDDYDNIIALLDEDNFTPRQFGDTIQESEAFAYIQSNVAGVDYMTITVPAFPISNADDEITTPGTLTLSEIP